MATVNVFKTEKGCLKTGDQQDTEQTTQSVNSKLSHKKDAHIPSEHGWRKFTEARMSVVIEDAVQLCTTRQKFTYYALQNVVQPESERMFQK